VDQVSPLHQMDRFRLEAGCLFSRSSPACFASLRHSVASRHRFNQWLNLHASQHGAELPTVVCLLSRRFRLWANTICSRVTWSW